MRIARGIDSWPEVAAAFADGLLSETHVDVIIDRCDPRFDRALVDARSWTDHQLRRMARCYPKPTPEPDVSDTEPGSDPEPPVANRCTFGWGDDGRLHGSFDLDAVTGSLVDLALRAARDRCYRERTGRDPDNDTSASLRVTWADALTRLAHAALDHLDPSTNTGGHPSSRYQVIVHIDTDRPDEAHINLGPLLSRRHRAEAACDADVIAILWRHGRPVNHSRRRRSPSPLLRALIEDRDGGCRICGATGRLHIHHLRWWDRDHGPTDDDNLLAACSACHHAIHTGDLTITGDPTRPDGLITTDRHGQPLPRPAPTTPTTPPRPPTRDHTGPIRGHHLRYMN